MRKNYDEIINMGKQVGIDLGFTADDLKRYELIAYFGKYHKDVDVEKLKELDTHTMEKVLEKLEEERLNKVINYLRND